MKVIITEERHGVIKDGKTKVKYRVVPAKQKGYYQVQDGIGIV